MLAEKQFRETEEMKAKAQISHAQPDDLIDFYHLKSRKVRKIALLLHFH
jgi:coatomer subunit beta